MGSSDQPRGKRDPFVRWLEAVEERHLADLTFQEVRRGVQALSVGYVQKRRPRLERALDSAGKRAAFALYYAPLHFLTVRAIVREIGAGSFAGDRIVDLGCGTGPAGAAWALEAAQPPSLVGVERHAWAAAEARWSYRVLGLRGAVRRVDLAEAALEEPRSGIVAAFTVNELESGVREILQRRLLRAGSAGASVLIVEPIARRCLPWWDDWAEAFTAAGGEAAEWRIPAALPPSLRLMDKAARLDHRELRARSLWFPGRAHRAPAASLIFDRG